MTEVIVNGLVSSIIHIIDNSVYLLLLKTGSLYNANSRNLIGLEAMLYEPLHHAREIATNKLS